MAHKPPIDITALEKAGILNEELFFQSLSAQNNHIDPKTARDWYFGLVRTITGELRKNGAVRLPELGIFALVKQKDKLGWVGKIRQVIVGKYTLKFYVKEAWSDYFAKLSGPLDPREKVLHRKL